MSRSLYYHLFLFISTTITLFPNLTNSEDVDKTATLDPNELLANDLLRGTRKQCRAEKGSVWLYGDLASHETQTAEQCCEMCDATEGCSKWSFGFAGKLKGKCLLRAHDAYAQPNADVISGRSTFKRAEPRRNEEL